MLGCAHSRGVMRQSETEAVVHLRTFVSLEAAYSASNGGYFDTPACLLDAQKCVPGYPASGPPFLTPELAQPPVGYRALFHPGPAAPNVFEPAISKTSVTSYAYTLEPSTPGARWLCADDRPTICVSGRTVSSPLPGRCPSSCGSLLP